MLSKKGRGDLQSGPSGRGRIIALEDRQALVRDIGMAQGAGARISKAGEACGIHRRTLHLWKADGLALQSGDRRPMAIRPTALRNRSSKPPSTGLSMSEVDSKIWIRPESGQADLCIGTTRSIGTVEAAMKAQISGMQVKTSRFWLHCITLTPKPPIQDAGLATPESGHRSAP